MSSRFSEYDCLVLRIKTLPCFLTTGARLEAGHERGGGQEVGPRRHRRRHLARHGIRKQHRHRCHQGQRQDRLYQVCYLLAFFKWYFLGTEFFLVIQYKFLFNFLLNQSILFNVSYKNAFCQCKIELQQEQWQKQRQMLESRINYVFLYTVDI